MNTINLLLFTFLQINIWNWRNLSVDSNKEIGFTKKYNNIVYAYIEEVFCFGNFYIYKNDIICGINETSTLNQWYDFIRYDMRYVNFCYVGYRGK